MITCVFGSSNSGKSRFAEDYVCRQNDCKNKYYLATMQVMEAEGEKRVDRHRKQREGKGFLTIEQPRDIFAQTKNYDFSDSIVLLECISNLVGNEMFSVSDVDTQIKQENELPYEKEVVNVLMKDILALSKVAKKLVIVSSINFEERDDYDEETRKYIQTIYALNERLKEVADEAYEVVAEIPRCIKQKGNQSCM